MQIRLKQALLALALVFLFCKVFAAEEVTLAGAPSGETFTLNQLSKMDTAVLEGNRPSYTFYIPVPEQWQVNSIDLNLIIQFSPLLLNSSTLTMMVGDVPVDTIRLDSKKEQPIFWKVSIPKAYISKKITTVRLIGYMKLSEDVCQDIENQGNWITLSGNSSITYHYQSKQAGSNLTEFPYPFIHKDAPFVDKVSFYLPVKTDAYDFAPYFKFANILAKEASWRGVELDMKSMSEFNAIATTFPSVIIGTPDSIDFSQLGTPDSLQLKNGQWLLSDGTPLNKENGFVWLSQRGQQPLLLISANSKKGLATAVESINNNMMHFTATNSSFFIAQPLAVTEKTVQKNLAASFRSMGYKDSVVFGTGKNELNFQFNIPVQYSNKPVKLVLRYSHSPFLQKDKDSTLGVSLNGLPLDGAILQSDSAQINVFELELPQKQLHVGKNTLTLTFNLLLSQNFCSRDYLSQAWGTIYDNSYLEFYQTKDPVRDQIKSWPDLMQGNVVVGLPNDPAVYRDKQAVREMIRFATMMDKSTSLDVMDTQSLKGQIGQHNLVYFGTGNDTSPILDSLEATFTQLVDNLNVTSNATLKGIDKSIFMNAFKQNQDIGFVGIGSTGPGKDFTQLVLFGFTTKELGLATGLLNNQYKLGFLSGNLAVSFQNGTFTSLSSNDIQENVQTEVAMEKVSQMTVNYVLSGLGALMLGILVFFGWRTWRKK